MPTLVLFDEFHVAFLAPKRLEEDRQRQIARTLRSKRFRLTFAAAVNAAISRFDELASVKVRLSH